MFGDEILRAKALPADDAERLLESVLASRRTEAKPEDVANLLVHLAKLATEGARYAVSLARLKEAVALFSSACGPDDARTRHARSEIAGMLERSGDLDGAVRVLQTFESDAARPGWRSEQIAALEERRGAAPAAADALEAARVSFVKSETDPMTSVDSIIRTSRVLAERGRVADARELVRGALAALHEIEVGRQMSMSARRPVDVRALLESEVQRLRDLD